MRIALITGIFPLLSEIYIIRQANALIDAGHEVDLFTMERSNQTLMQSEINHHDLLDKSICLRDNYKDYNNSHFLERMMQDLTLTITVLWRHPQAVRLIYETTGLNKLRQLRLPLYQLSRFSHGHLHNYDIVHCHFGHVAKRLLYTKSLFRSKLMVSFHGTDYHTYPEIHGASTYAEVFKQADLVSNVCQAGCRRLVELGCPQHKVVTQYTGIDLDRFTYQTGPTRPKGSIRILTVARLVPIKGIDWAIKAIAILAQSYAIQYEIIGDGELASKLKTLVNALKLNDRVQFRGPAISSQIIASMQTADIFLLTSHNEGIPGVTLEAQATGLPVVATRVGGTSEGVINGVTGFLVTPGDDQDIANHLAILIENPRLRIDMGLAGRAHVAQSFCMHKSHRILEQRYRQLLKTEQD